jgi:hypothetical protein
MRICPCCSTAYTASPTCPTCGEASAPPPVVPPAPEASADPVPAPPPGGGGKRLPRSGAGSLPS